MARRSAERNRASDAPPAAPRGLVYLGLVLAVIVGILASLDKIQDYLCRHGLGFVCAAQFKLVLGIWAPDAAAGWMADISNPTGLAASISDARLVFKRPSPEMPYALTLFYAPSEWKGPDRCDQQSAPIPTVVLQPQGVTKIRLILYGSPAQSGNKAFMQSMDKTIPDRPQLSCEVQVDVVAGDGQQHTLSSEFSCSRLSRPPCN
jgi:hypothetical protein